MVAPHHYLDRSFVIYFNFDSRHAMYDVDPIIKNPPIHNVISGSYANNA